MHAFPLVQYVLLFIDILQYAGLISCTLLHSFLPSQIVTLEEHLQLVLSADRTIGIIPELKHSTYFNNLDIFKNVSIRITEIKPTCINSMHQGGLCEDNSRQIGRAHISAWCYPSCMRDSSVLYMHDDLIGHFLNLP